jgi:anti-anti-sigma factor
MPNLTTKGSSQSKTGVTFPLTRVNILESILAEEKRMNSDLKIMSEQRQAAVPVTVFLIRGWLDGQSEGQFLEAARNAYEGGARYLLIDMSDLDTITSAGIRAMQKLYQMYTPKEDQHKVAHLKLCNAPPQIYNVLGITGFLQNIPMYENQDDALESFGKEMN